MRVSRALAVVCLTLLSSAALPANAATTTGWQAVEALAPNTRVHIKADTRSSNCHITAVTDDKLTCSEGVFSRSEIKSIKLVDKTKSTLSGLALGGGIGAGAGAGIGSAINAGDTGSYVHVSGGKSAGVGAAVGVIVGAGIGALVGHSANLFAATIYKR